MRMSSLVGRSLPILKRAEPWARDFVTLFIRITIGWSFFQAGKDKLGNLERTAGSFDSLGIFLPGFHAALVGFTEMIGGLLLLVGLLARVASVPLGITMIAALLIAHREEAAQGIPELVRESPFPFLMGALVILAFGPGRASLDCLVSWFLARKNKR